MCIPAPLCASPRKAPEGDQGDDAEGGRELGGTLPGPVEAQSSTRRVTWGLLDHHHSSALGHQWTEVSQYRGYLDNPGLMPERITSQWSWHGRARVLVAGEQKERWISRDIYREIGSVKAGSSCNEKSLSGSHGKPEQYRSM